MARRVVARRVVASAAELVRGCNRNPLRTTPGRARRVVASAAELVRGSNRNPLRTTPGKARRGSLKNFVSRVARVVLPKDGKSCRGRTHRARYYGGGFVNGDG